MSIIEVARIAGVSTATVSRAINNHPWVSADAAESVRRAIKQIGYIPSRKAPRRNFLLPRRGAVGTRKIALLFPDPNADAMKTVLSGRLAHGVNQELRKHELSLIFAGLADWDKMPPCIEQGEVDGVILRGTVPIDHLLPLLRSIPCVTVFETPGVPVVGDQVMDDSAAIGEMAASWLLQRRCRNVAFMNRDVLHPSHAARGEGFTKALRNTGIEVQNICFAAPYPELVDRFLALSPRPTGLFIPGHDNQVCGLYQAFDRKGVRLGRDIQLICCNYDPALLETLDPSLARIDVSPEQIGIAAAETMLWRLKHPSAPRRRMLVAPVLVEPSTA